MHVPTDVGGNPQGLSQAERRIGVKSHSCVFLDSIYEYKGKEVIFKPDDGFLMRELRRYIFFMKSIFTYNVFHFNFGQTIFPSQYSDVSTKFRFPFRLINSFFTKIRKFYAIIFSLKDLPILYILGKRIFVTFQGDDARQAIYCRKNFPIHFVNEVPEDYYPKYIENIKPLRIQKFAKYAKKIYALNPDLLWVLPEKTEFLPYAHVDLKDWRPIPISKRAPLHIIHAPSDRNVKGTRYLLSALEQIRTEGVEFKFTLVENLPNHEARRIYENADILVDQLLAGWYGGLAVELMALGKPVICYIRESDLVHIPDEMKLDLPIIKSDPYEITEVLRRVISMPRYELQRIGNQSRAFVEKWHDPIKIAMRIIQDYQNC